jgi:hypothetical protein
MGLRKFFFNSGPAVGFGKIGNGWRGDELIGGLKTLILWDPINVVARLWSHMSIDAIYI